MTTEERQSDENIEYIMDLNGTLCHYEGRIKACDIFLTWLENGK